MKHFNNSNNIKNLKIVITTILMVTARISYSHTDTSNLVKKAEEIIASYYTERFNITSNQDGIITVSGEAETLFDKLKIGELISWVEGVKELNNKIEVKTDMLPNKIIKINIEDELERNNAILEPEKINITVKDGTVHLSGTVNNIREKLLAQSISAWQNGVTGMTTDLVVLSPAKARSDENLKEIFSDILKRNFSLEKNITVRVNNGEVYLSGRTRSMYAKNLIPEKIRNVPGVKEVINKISLEKNIY